MKQAVVAVRTCTFYVRLYIIICAPVCIQGEIWNDLGVIFTQIREYEEAYYCFKKAHAHLENSRTTAEATVLQNVGAACNILENYREGIEFHEKAAKVFGKVYAFLLLNKCDLLLID